MSIKKQISNILNLNILNWINDKIKLNANACINAHIRELKEKTGVSSAYIIELKEKIGAGSICDVYGNGKYGIYMVNWKCGIVNFINGEIIKKPFADWIHPEGIYIKNYKQGIVNLETGKILKAPFADWIDASGIYRIVNEYKINNEELKDFKIDIKNGERIDKNSFMNWIYNKDNDNTHIVESKYGIVSLKTGKIIKKAFANWICDIYDNNGIYIINGKWGIISLKTGKIIKKLFADWIGKNGIFRIKNKYGIISLETGEIIKKPIFNKLDTLEWVGKNWQDYQKVDKRKHS